MFFKETLSFMAIAITFIAFIPYIKSILKGATRPHVFSWVIWGTTTFVIFLAQLQGKAGIGAWPIGVSGIVTLLIAVLAYSKRADISITLTDWLFFIIALTSLPVWAVTSDPLWAVVILTTIDTIGFGPTIRKACQHPDSESRLFYALFVARNTMVILALETYSVTTVLFPAVTAVACILLLTVITFCRRAGQS